MSIPGAASPLFLGAAAVEAGPYQIDRSLRFNSADSSYLSFQPSSAGNRRTWTWSGWVKRSGLTDTYPTIFGAGTGGNSEASIRFNSNSTIEFYAWTGGYNARLLTTQVFRDTSAWYHLVAVFDTTNATASNRIRLYINGSEITTFSSSTTPGLNYEGYVNNSISHTIGDAAPGASPRFFNGYLADVHFIDGQALAPTDFGEYDDNNVWQPKAYSGTYGTNGFHLDFSDNSSNAALGDDSSGNNNDWTVNNLSVASGAGNDSLIDTPTNYTAASGNNGGNYATLNPLNTLGSSPSLANGNLQITSTASYDTLSTIGVSSGKWYCELTVTAKSALGIAGIIDIQNTRTSQFSLSGQNYVAYRSTGTVEGNQTGGTGFTWVQGDTLGFALDLDSGTQTLKVYKNGSLQSTSNITASGVTWAMNYFYSEGTSDYTVNFGQRPFAYTPPTGYLSLCTQNLPDPTIADGSTAMDVALYTGNGSTQTISGLNFSPDFVWLKNRANTVGHNLYDVIRGVNKPLITNSTAAEESTNIYGAVSAFNSDGFDVQVGSTDATRANATSTSYVGWAWDGGTSTVTNTDGSITSSVRANASAGFSIANYVGNNTAGATVGHGLNDAPRLILVKDRDSNPSWAVYHYELGATKFLRLDTTDAATTNSNRWNNTEPTGSVFTVGTASSTNGNNGNNYIAYCFAPVAGYSAFGSYTGNGSTDGPMVYTGFRPKLIILKKIDSDTDPGGWIMMDAERDSYNVTANQLYAQDSAAENGLGVAGKDDIDILSNGFKLRGDGGWVNGSNKNIIYMAWAESPFKTARAR